LSDSGSTTSGEAGGKKEKKVAERDAKGTKATVAQGAGGGDVLRRTLLIVWAEKWVSVVFFMVLFVMGGATALVESLVFLFFTKGVCVSYALCLMPYALSTVCGGGRHRAR